MSMNTIIFLLTTSALVIGCGSTKPESSVAAPANASASANSTKATSSATASTGINGTIASGSKFSKIKIGMQFKEVNDLIGTPDDLSRNETGKRWIPFYFGSDVVRMQASYKGEGCLTYTGGNQFGSAGGELIQISVDPKGCV